MNIPSQNLPSLRLRQVIQLPLNVCTIWHRHRVFGFITSATAITVLCTKVHWHDINLKMCIDFLSSNIGSLLIFDDPRVKTNAYNALSSDAIIIYQYWLFYFSINKPWRNTLTKRGQRAVQMLSIIRVQGYGWNRWSEIQAQRKTSLM